MSINNVTVFANIDEENQRAVGVVAYNSDLDRWGSNDWHSDGPGYHRGIAQLEDGRWVIIAHNRWQGGSGARAYVVSDEEALNEVLDAGHEGLLVEPRFADLKALYDHLAEKPWQYRE